MSRKPREYCHTNIYHIINKGIDGQDIFLDDKDKMLFLEKLQICKIEYKVMIYAYCLMNNHVHLVIEINKDKLSKMMKCLNVSYALYFNNKYSRAGVLFQNRFKSKCIYNQKYFLDVCRYVEQNPEKAGICITEKYKWSSYHEYIGNEEIINKKKIMDTFGNDVNKYIFFTTKGKSSNREDFMEFEIRNKMQDEELTELLVKELKLKNISEFKQLNNEEFKKGLEFLKNLKYTKLRQISRVIGMNMYQIKKYWK